MHIIYFSILYYFSTVLGFTARALRVRILVARCGVCVFRGGPGEGVGFAKRIRLTPPESGNVYLFDISRLLCYTVISCSILEERLGHRCPIIRRLS